MKNIMFGEASFLKRSALLDLVADVRAFAEEVGEDLSGECYLDELLSELKASSFFVVYGVSGVGKSTFLNGLFGNKIFGGEKSQQGRKVQWFRYGAEANRPVTESFEECYRDSGFLMDFNVIDTLGISEKKSQHQKIAERFLPVADVLFFVFHVNDPWAAKTWDLLTHLSDAERDKAIIIVQQSDLVAQQDANMIVGLMCNLSQQKLGRIIPVHAVSARDAIESKASEVIDISLWEKSGYRSVEQFISKQFLEDIERKETTDKVYLSTVRSLRHIEVQISKISKEIDEKLLYVNELEGMIDKLRDARLGSRMPIKVFSHIFADSSVEIMKYMKSRLGVIPSILSLFSSVRLPFEVEREYEAVLETHLKKHLNEEVDKMAMDCENHWLELKPSMEKSLGLKQPDFHENTAGFIGIRARFVDRLTRASSRALQSINLRTSIRSLIAARKNRLRIVLFVSLLFVAVGGGLGASNMPLLGIVPCFVIAAFVLLGALPYVIFSRRKILRSFEEHCLQAKHEFPELLLEDYKAGIRKVYVEYGSLLDEVRNHAGREKKSVDLMFKKWNELYSRTQKNRSELA